MLREILPDKMIAEHFGKHFFFVIQNTEAQIELNRQLLNIADLKNRIIC